MAHGRHGESGPTANVALRSEGLLRSSHSKCLSGSIVEFGLAHIGMYAGDSMRMEKVYGYWKANFHTDHLQKQARLSVGLHDRQVDAVVSALCSFDPDNTLPGGVAT